VLSLTARFSAVTRLDVPAVTASAVFHVDGIKLLKQFHT
jgi:hypothetical protein